MATTDEQLHIDEGFMRECIRLADEAGQSGDLPFGSVVVHDNKIIGRGSNVLQQKLEIDGHAERIALLEAQKHMNARTLDGCTVYTTVEPCPMCSFPMRELHIHRVVFGLRSPVMGGCTRFEVLQDKELSEKIPEYFGEPPIIESGVLRDECIESWKKYAPRVWESLSSEGVLC